jgi:hypothetical protein
MYCSLEFGFGMSDNQILSICRFSAESAQKAAISLIGTYFV